MTDFAVTIIKNEYISCPQFFLMADSNSTPAEQDKEARTHGENTKVCELNTHH